MAHDYNEDIIPGTLFAFVDPNGIEYRAKFSDGIFHGYYSSVNGYFSDTITVSSDDNSYSVLLPSAQPEIFVLVKIAEMAKRHETYFYDFTIHFNNWTNEMNGGVWGRAILLINIKGTFLQEGNRIEHNPFLYDFYCDFLREFMDYVDYRQELTAQCLDFAFDLFSMDLLTTLSETGFSII
ncbi:MAG: hypothetical protein IPM74_08585 [Crocinitomicaceae bacterium]|nr:hypothetical protein [Crocinitomicaceae bacterium]